jgi:hypothetical protein
VSSQPVKEGSGGGSQPTTRQWILLGVLGAVLLIVLAVVVRPLLTGSGGDEPAPEALPPATVPSPTTTTLPGTATTAPDGSTARVLTPAIARRTARDPFRNLNATTTTTTATTGGPTTTTGNGPEDRLTVVSVTGSGDDARVTVSVNGTRYTGGVGDTLAGTYVVVSATAECADFRADGDTFTKCEGATTDK